MRKLITAAQFKEADEFTIKEGISSLKLMEKASIAFVKTFIQRFPERRKNITFFCGKGNNGGDGLAISRLLFEEGYVNQRVFVIDFTPNASPDFSANLEQLNLLNTDITFLKTPQDLPDLVTELIIDAIFGSGLNRALSQDLESLINKINAVQCYKVAVDIPTGMPANGDFYDCEIFKADWVISFQRPKINFLLPESAPYIKDWKVINIGISESFLEELNSPYRWVWKGDFKDEYKARGAFDHKGTFGHLLIIAGNTETIGAALLCAEAAANTGAGLTTVSLPDSGLIALNSRIPEAMFLSRDLNIDYLKYNSLAIGPGLGKSNLEVTLLKEVLENYKGNLILDADALNILAGNKKLLSLIPANSIITPHAKEFDRLFGEHKTWWQRIETAKKQSKKLKIIIVLKNRYTITCSPDGLCYFNSSGTPAMASGGMGDVLTGIIASLLAQHYTPIKAAILGVYLHGRCGEVCAQKMSVVLPTTLIKQISYTMADLLN